MARTMARFARLPAAGKAVDVRLQVTAREEGEEWRRTFAGRHLVSMQSARGAGLLVERDMTVPEDMAADLRTLVQRCVDTCAQSANIISELDELVETGFRGPEATRVEEMVEKLNLIEDETDQLGMSLARSLFKHEETMSAVSVMFWYQLIQWIGDLADYAEKVGDRLRLLIAR